MKTQQQLFTSQADVSLVTFMKVTFHAFALRLYVFMVVSSFPVVFFVCHLFHSLSPRSSTATTKRTFNCVSNVSHQLNFAHAQTISKAQT